MISDGLPSWAPLAERGPGDSRWSAFALLVCYAFGSKARWRDARCLTGRPPPFSTSSAFRLFAILAFWSELLLKFLSDPL